MTKGISVWLALVAVLALVATDASVRADDVAVANAESRRRAAENGLRAIKQKSDAEAERVRVLYTEAAERHNAWLDMTVAGLGGVSAPDVKATADAAAAALIPWVNARNQVVGHPQLSAAVGEVTKRDIVANLVAVSNATWKDQHHANPQKRAKAVETLRERLTWMPFADVSATAAER